MDKDSLFQLEIICPERLFYKGEASMVEFTTSEGDIGVYKNHIPLTAMIAPGVLTITGPEGEKKAALHRGFVEILQDKVTMLAETAEWPDEIDPTRAEEAKERANRRLKSREEEINMARAEAALKRALIRLEVKK